MAVYAPSGKPVSEIPVEQPAVKRGPGRPPKAGKPARRKKVSCDKIVFSLADAGFFSEGRGFGAIKSEITTTEPGCTDNKIRKALKNAISASKLVSNGAGRGMKYIQFSAT